MAKKIYSVQNNEQVAFTMKLLDELGDALKEKGISLDEMLASGEEIRKELIREKYGLEETDDSLE